MHYIILYKILKLILFKYKLSWVYECTLFPVYNLKMCESTDFIIKTFYKIVDARFMHSVVRMFIY